MVGLFGKRFLGKAFATRSRPSKPGQRGATGSARRRRLATTRCAIAAEAEVAAVRDDPRRGLRYVAVSDGPTGRAPRHLPFRRAAFSFMRWQARAGVLGSAEALSAGQRVVARDERAPAAGRMRDDRTAGSVARRPVIAGRPAAGWSSARDRRGQLVPRPRRQHRRRLPGGLEPAEAEGEAERFFMNVALAARPLRACPRCGAAPCAGRFAALGRMLGDPGSDGRRVPLAAPRAARTAIR